MLAVNVEIIDKPLTLSLYGFAGVADNKDYAGAAFKLSGKMWDVVKSNGLKNKGKNVWVYNANDIIFAGVELDEIPAVTICLEHKVITLTKYAYYKHTGAYQLIKQVGLAVNAEIKNKGLTPGVPYIEIYGHWTSDETKLETELMVSLV